MLAYWHILKLHPCNLSFGTMKIEVPGHPLCILSLELPGICLLEGEKTVMILGYPHGCTARGLWIITSSIVRLKDHTCFYVSASVWPSATKAYWGFLRPSKDLDKTTWVPRMTWPSPLHSDNLERLRKSLALPTWFTWPGAFSGDLVFFTCCFPGNGWRLWNWELLTFRPRQPDALPTCRNWFSAGLRPKFSVATRAIRWRACHPLQRLADGLVTSSHSGEPQFGNADTLGQLTGADFSVVGLHASPQFIIYIILCQWYISILAVDNVFQRFSCWMWPLAGQVEQCNPPFPRNWFPATEWAHRWTPRGKDTKRGSAWHGGMEPVVI